MNSYLQRRDYRYMSLPPKMTHLSQMDPSHYLQESNKYIHKCQFFKNRFAAVMKFFFLKVGPNHSFTIIYDFTTDKISNKNDLQ